MRLVDWSIPHVIAYPKQYAATVTTDELGAAQAVAPAVQSYEPTDAQIAHHLARFVRNVRSLLIDPIVVRKRWLEA